MTGSMIASFQLPFALKKMLDKEAREFSIPASFEEYLEFADKYEFKAEYSNGNITSMGHPTDTHEKICANIIGILHFLFGEDDPQEIYGSNLGLLLEETGAHYRPDTTMLASAPIIVEHKVGKLIFKSVSNPYAVFEVFSSGTVAYDMDEKLPNYKLSKHIQYIVYIHQHRPYVTVWARSEKPGAWVNQDYNGLETAFELDGKRIDLSKIYKKVAFIDAGKKRSRKKRIDILSK